MNKKVIVLAMLAALAATPALAEKGDFWFGLNTGVSSPTGDVGDSQNLGFQGTLVTNYMLTPAFGIGVDLGYHMWSFDDAVIPDGADASSNVIQATAQGTYMFPTSGKMLPYLKGGLGMYRGKAEFSGATDPSNNFVRILWQNIPEWSTTSLNTMQVVLWSSGQVDISYGVVGNSGGGQAAGNDAIIGFTPGNGANLPPQTNFVTGLPFQSGDGSIPPIQSMSARPVIGTTSQITTTNITPGTLFVFEVMGFGHTGANGIDLGFIGMPNCRQYVQPFATILLPVVGGVASASLTIPNNPSYQNVQVFAQSAPLTAGLNPAGILTSNGLCIKAGQ